MIDFILTNRNRDICIIKNCLDSLLTQTNLNFELHLIDYGSSPEYIFELDKLVSNYNFVNFFKFPTHFQLWNKSRSINYILKNSNKDYIFVGDIDMIYHKDFIYSLIKNKVENGAVYFKVGYLSKNEAKFKKNFDDYSISHYSNFEATGMTLYKKELLLSLNGFDEFYHGWGAEDTDVHFRFLNAGYEIKYYDDETLILHQWHPKIYRTKKSNDPFHSNLEIINSRYLKSSKDQGFEYANLNFEIGKFPVFNLYKRLDEVGKIIFLTNEKFLFDSFIIGTIYNYKNVVLNVIINEHLEMHSLKNLINKIARRKHSKYYKLQEINDLLIEQIITNFRNNPYRLIYNRVKKEIILKILIN